jgi:hypothetical protein
MQLVHLDPVFYLAARAIKFLVQRSRRALEVDSDKLAVV